MAYKVPTLIIDAKETRSLELLSERYEKLVAPSTLNQLGDLIYEYTPQQLLDFGSSVKATISEQDLFASALEVITNGFDVVTKTVAKYSISETSIINNVNEKIADNEITDLKAICLARSYDIAEVVSSYKTSGLALALIEGGVTGYFGFAGLPFNLVLSTFIYYRGVQSIAMHYGYDVKNDATELVIASEVFMNALNPNQQGTDGLTSTISKFMVFAELSAVKQTAKKTWTEMAARGGASLLATQMRALANTAAKKALENAGKKGLENSLFKGVFEQIGRSLTQKTIGKSIPVIGSVFGSLYDTAQMNTVLEFADVFYNKRFIVEKEMRINQLLQSHEDSSTDVNATEETL
ncbi:EcsC protein family protein [Arcanobacterium phocae]|uniref:EcsC protein family protein n=2 Tax=Arcanobacterium phocae TaxID=131112 RepID=A0A1H2LF93_9ACTO|nr:EcsC protein family protein [Arcanobacterium phocae]